MKKAITLITLFASLLLTLCSCVDIDSTGDQGKGSASADTKATSGTDGVVETDSSDSLPDSKLGDFDVVIDSCRIATDYEGKPIVIVKYEFTNNSDDTESFGLALKDAAFQDGIGLNTCYFVDDSANYSSENQLKEIKTGATLSVEVAYELNDTTTDVEIEVSELISFNDRKLTKTFSIAE